MQIKGIITKITKNIINAKAVFNVQLDGASAAEYGCGQMECLYFNSKLQLYMPVILDGDMNNGRFAVTKMTPYFSRSDQVVRFMLHKVKGCGLGTKRIEAIVDQFGADVMSMDRDTFYEKLKNEFEGGISIKAIDKFLAAWFVSAGTISELE